MKLLSFIASGRASFGAVKDNGVVDLGSRMAAGKLRYRESIVEGLENAPRGLIELLAGKNFGKQLVKL